MVNRAIIELENRIKELRIKKALAEVINFFEDNGLEVERLMKDEDNISMDEVFIIYLGDSVVLNQNFIDFYKRNSHGLYTIRIMINKERLCLMFYVDVNVTDYIKKEIIL